jgi:hypothetical protein
MPHVLALTHCIVVEFKLQRTVIESSRTFKEPLLPRLGAFHFLPSPGWDRANTVQFSREREFPVAKDLNVGQFIDASFIKATDQSGFIDKPYR